MVSFKLKYCPYLDFWFPLIRTPRPIHCLDFHCSKNDPSKFFQWIGKTLDLSIKVIGSLVMSDRMSSGYNVIPQSDSYTNGLRERRAQEDSGPETVSLCQSVYFRLCLLLCLRCKGDKDDGSCQRLCKHPY